MEITKVAAVFVLGTLLALAVALVSLNLAKMGPMRSEEKAKTGAGVSVITIYNGGLPNSSLVLVNAVNTEPIAGSVKAPNSTSTSPPIAYFTALYSTLSNLEGELEPVQYYETTSYAYFATFKWGGNLVISGIVLPLKNATIVIPYYLWATHSWREALESKKGIIFLEAPPNSTLLVSIVLNQPTNVSVFSVPGYLYLKDYTVSNEGEGTAVTFVYGVGDVRNTLVVLPLIYGNFTYLYVVYVE